jgi:hypothetical protein
VNGADSVTIESRPVASLKGVGPALAAARGRHH